METKNCTRLDQETEALLEWHATVADRHDDDFEAAKEIVTRLGAHYEDGVTEVGFWTPVIVEDGVPECYEEDHPACESCVQDIADGVVETW